MSANQNGCQTEGDKESDKKRESWAQRIGNSVYYRQNKNILEVSLEKDSGGAFAVTDSDCARLLSKLGLDLRPGIHMEGVQVCPNGRGVILITLKDNVRPEQFCRYDVLQVNNTGVRSVLVKPGGKRDVVMTFKGIHPNTKDSVVLTYLTKFGVMPQAKVVYGIFTDGPLKGMRNGDRQYKVEVKPGINLGTYHLIDGVKVSLRYAGQHHTCGRCHMVASNCKGGGIAKRCELQGGVKVEFKKYIHDLWNDIGYVPDIDHDEDDNCDDLVESADQFTPYKVQSFPVDNFTGVSIKKVPKDTDHGEILEFLMNNGLPDDKKEAVQINSNGSIIINNLDNYIVEYLIESIHGKVYFDKKLYCNGILPLTPDKHDTVKDSLSIPTLVNSTKNSTSDPQNVQVCDESVENLVRRNSLSLLNRTPNKNSLAEELLNTPRANLQKTSSVIDEINDKLSDFASCLSSSEASNDENELGNEGFKAVSENKRQKKNKRKMRESPNKEFFLKKPNLAM